MPLLPIETCAPEKRMCLEKKFFPSIGHFLGLFQPSLRLFKLTALDQYPGKTIAIIAIRPLIANVLRLLKPFSILLLNAIEVAAMNSYQQEIVVRYEHTTAIPCLLSHAQETT